jgi:MFS family permease
MLKASDLLLIFGERLCIYQSGNIFQGLVMIKGLYREYDRRVWILFSSRFVAAMGFSVAMPFLSLYLYQELGVEMKIVGTIFMISAASRALGTVVGGELSDIRGRRMVMVSSMSLRAVVYLGISYLVLIRAPYGILGLALVISSFLGSVFIPASSAMVADVVSQEKRVKAYGLIRVGVNAGWALGPILGGIFATFSYSTLFLFTALCSLLTALLIGFFVRESLQGEERKAFSPKDLLALRRDVNFFSFCLISLILFVATSQMTSTLAVFSVDRVGITKIQLGYLFTTNGLIVVLLQYHLSSWLRGLRITSAMALGGILYSLGYFSVSLAGSFPFLVTSMVVITLGEITFSPSAMTMVANLSPSAVRGRYMGAYSLFEAIGRSLGPFGGGFALDYLKDYPIFLWGLIALLALGGSLGFYRLGRRIPTHLNSGLGKGVVPLAKTPSPIWAGGK